MRGTLVALGLVVAGLVTYRADVDACGDKSFAAGGIRMQRALAARYPASIVIYAQPSSRIAAAARELKLQQTFQQVGHKYREVTTAGDLKAALETGQFNIVMADFAELADMQQRLESLRSRPALVAVAYKLTKAETAEAARQCRFLINAPGRAAQYLSTIADAVRSTGSPAKI
jgi:hypothetical protein